MSWPIILIILVVGYVLGRARPLRTWHYHNDQLDSDSIVVKAAFDKKRGNTP
jgi:hypothetical protein